MILALPPEIILQVLALVPLRYQCAFRQTCVDADELCRDHILDVGKLRLLRAQYRKGPRNEAGIRHALRAGYSDDVILAFARNPTRWSTNAMIAMAQRQRDSLLYRAFPTADSQTRRVQLMDFDQKQMLIAYAFFGCYFLASIFLKYWGCMWMSRGDLLVALIGNGYVHLADIAAKHIAKPPKLSVSVIKTMIEDGAKLRACIDTGDFDAVLYDTLLLQMKGILRDRLVRQVAAVALKARNRSALKQITQPVEDGQYIVVDAAAYNDVGADGIALAIEIWPEYSEWLRESVVKWRRYECTIIKGRRERREEPIADTADSDTLELDAFDARKSHARRRRGSSRQDSL